MPAVIYSPSRLFRKCEWFSSFKNLMQIRMFFDGVEEHFKTKESTVSEQTSLFNISTRSCEEIYNINNCIVL